jgi:hypothetical protein
MKEPLCPIKSIEYTLAFASKDWSLDKDDAWIYGIVIGWDDDSLDELKVSFGWSDETVLTLKELHKKMSSLSKLKKPAEHINNGK